MLTYEELLEKGMKKIKKLSSESRFTMPKAHVMLQGARTIIFNFSELVSALRRKQEHILKFLLKELATSYEVKGKNVIFQGRFPKELIDKKLELYVKNYVLCPACNKPDTKIVRQARLDFLKCEACGAKHAIKKIK